MKMNLMLSTVAWVFLTLTASGFQKDGHSGLQVDEAKLCKEVKNRMTMDEDSSFVKGTRVFFWMKIVGGSSDEITVTWKTGDYTHATTLTIGGSPWRTWATKIVDRTGEWTVTVTDSSEIVLKEMKFNVK